MPSPGQSSPPSAGRKTPTSVIFPFQCKPLQSEANCNEEVKDDQTSKTKADQQRNVATTLLEMEFVRSSNRLLALLLSPRSLSNTHKRPRCAKQNSENRRGTSKYRPTTLSSTSHFLRLVPHSTPTSCGAVSGPTYFQLPNVSQCRGTLGTGAQQSKPTPSSGIVCAKDGDSFTSASGTGRRRSGTAAESA
jgi:hypothetical protein